jgi:3-hydroxyacyl-[acyl-carrier-protein] dehydratase
MAQTAGALCMRHIEEFKEPPLVYFMAIDKARFRRPVVPGDTLRIEMTLVRLRGRTCRMTGTATVDGARVAEATLTAVVVDREPQESRP